VVEEGAHWSKAEVEVVVHLMMVEGGEAVHG
jgi:hypothetical protein